MRVAHLSFAQFDGTGRRRSLGEHSFVAMPRMGESVGVRLGDHIHYGNVDAVEHRPRPAGEAGGEPMVMILLTWRAKYEALPGD